MLAILKMIIWKERVFSHRYEGDFKEGKKEGKGVFYYNNGDREMGDFMNDAPVGMHVKYCIEGKIKKVYY